MFTVGSVGQYHRMIYQLTLGRYVGQLSANNLVNNWLIYQPGI